MDARPSSARWIGWHARYVQSWVFLRGLTSRMNRFGEAASARGLTGVAFDPLVRRLSQSHHHVDVFGLTLEEFPGDLSRGSKPQ